MTRVALITGGASGIGRACAERLRAEGTRVITVDKTGDADHLIDVSDPTAVNALADALGAIDILVNSAGVLGPKKPMVEMRDEEWARAFAVNATGTFYTCRAFVPRMASQGWGRIVNIGSAAGMEGVANNSAYSAAKGAVIAFTKALGKELAATGILVNGIAPGFIRTPMTVANNSQEAIAQTVGRLPMGREGRPEEVAELVAWLASDRLSYSAGAIYDISGGRASY